MILLCGILWENGWGKGRMVRRSDEGYTLLANDRYATMLQLESFNELVGDALAFIVRYRLNRANNPRESMARLKLFTLAAFSDFFRGNFCILVLGRFSPSKCGMFYVQ